MTERDADSCAIGILARAPIPGRVKTRLIPILGPEGAARFQATSLHDTIALVGSLAWPTRLFLTPISARSAIALRGVSVPIEGQGSGLLGTRMASALERLLDLPGVDRALIIGTDSPDLPPARIETAAETLKHHPVTLVPAQDGGFVLLGIRKGVLPPGRLSRLLRPVLWSSPHTCRDTALVFREHGVEPWLLEAWSDVDEPDDLRELRDRIQASRDRGNAVPMQTAALLDELTG